MNKPTTALVGIGVGAGLMYMADPVAGRRRRGRARDIAAHAWRVLRTATGASTHDAENRLTGLVARTRLLLRGSDTPIDDVLAARVRARLGRLVAHPRGVEVHVNRGVVTLSGDLTDTEASRVLSEVGRVRGVTDVEDRLDRVTS